MNVALGFDTYLVMRHGLPSSSSSEKVDSAQVKPGSIYRGQLGCYYCNDVVAPMDVSVKSLSKRGDAVPAVLTKHTPRRVRLRSPSATELSIRCARSHGLASRASPPRRRSSSWCRFCSTRKGAYTLFVRTREKGSTDSSTFSQPTCAVYNPWAWNRIVLARTSRVRRGRVATRNRAASDSRLPRQL